jgi:hypothetical protein
MVNSYIRVVPSWVLVRDKSQFSMIFQIFGSVGPNIITTKFENATGFTQSSSRLLVTEVRRRASNQSTETAAQAIAAFMQVNEQ